jgi:hypothetical protein
MTASPSRKSTPLAKRTATGQARWLMNELNEIEREKIAGGEE